MVGAPEIISEINKVKLPYNINFFSEFVASLLLEKREHIKESITVSIYERDLLLDFLKSKPFDNVYPSAANFILVRTKNKKALFDSLKSNDILVRDVSSYPMLDNCLRISVGTPEENNLLKDAITMFFSGSH
jgi:histidinol-phosphate aminotransferase